MKNKITVVLIILFTIFVSYLTIQQDPKSVKFLIDFQFLFSFIGVLIGFALSLFTHIASLIDGLLKKEENTEKSKKRREILLNIFTEIKEDIYLIFISLVTVIIIYLFNKPIYSYFKDIIDTSFFLNNLMKISLFSIFVLNIISIGDIIITAFKLTEFVYKEELPATKEEAP